MYTYIIKAKGLTSNSNSDLLSFEVQKTKEIISIDICIQKNPAWLSLHSVQITSNES
jgi:hypothetical protein